MPYGVFGIGGFARFRRQAKNTALIGKEKKVEKNAFFGFCPFRLHCRLLVRFEDQPIHKRASMLRKRHP